MPQEKGKIRLLLLEYGEPEKHKFGNTGRYTLSTDDLREMLTKEKKVIKEIIKVK